MALLSKPAKLQFTDDDGTPLAGGKLYTYLTATNTPQATYQDRAGTVENTNPIILDSRGEATIYRTSGVVYTDVLKRSDGSTVWTRDGVEADELAADLISEDADKGAHLVMVTRAGNSRRLDAKLLDWPLSISDAGAVNDGSLTATLNTVAIQDAIDAVFDAGGGAVLVPEGDWLFGASSLSETYSNAGAAVPASTCGIVLRKGVDLIGRGRGRTKFTTTDRTIFAIALIAPDGNTVQGIELAGDWDQGESGAGHGIITFATESGADLTCKKVTLRDLYVHNFGSYGIGFQCGFPMDCLIDNVLVEYTGADGIDLKARTDATADIEPAGNRLSNVVVKHFGLRVEGSAGIDVRGLWTMSNVHILDFGGNASLYYVGVRFRTKEDPATNKWPGAGKRSSLTNFYINPGPSPVGTGFTGVSSGSDSVSIASGTIMYCTNGVDITGNTEGYAERNTVVAVSVIDCTQYGFRAVAGVVNATFVGCHSSSNGTAGFRNEGTGTRLIGCSGDEATRLSTSAGALSTEQVIGSDLGPEQGISTYSTAAGTVILAARGPSTNIDVQLTPRGTGVLRYGTHTANADAPVSGYITIKDSGGTTRKLAVIT